MKQVFKMYVPALIALVFAVNASAQDSTKFTKKVTNGVKSAGKAVGKGASTAGKAVAKGASATGKKTAEIASKGKSAVVDKVYEGKKGPDGQTIYINDKAQYYWVDKTGHHHFVTKAQLVDEKK